MAIHSSILAWRIPWTEKLVLHVMAIGSQSQTQLKRFNMHSFGHRALLWWLSSKESACNAGATGAVCSIPGWGRFPGGGHGNQFQYSCAENPMDRGASWATIRGVAKSQTNCVTKHTKAFWTMVLG